MATFTPMHIPDVILHLANTFLELELRIWAEIRERMHSMRKCEGNPQSKNIRSGYLFPTQFLLLHTNRGAPLSLQ